MPHSEPEKSLPFDKSATFFKRLLLNHSTPNANPNPTSPEQYWDMFGSEEVKLILDYCMTGFFQHYRLFQHVFNTEQERMEVEETPHVETFDPLPLWSAITLEDYNIELQKQREAEEIQRAEMERRRAEKRAAAVNPFEVLSPEEIKAIATETIHGLLSNLNQEYEKLLEEQKLRVMEKISKLGLTTDPL
ncbi:hypothetical protein HK102_008527 [Quaeritorhiza haematococci]|nr:hypothetical protein HK102_008527 [Quaeritorhiza haematococci]